MRARPSTDGPAGDGDWTAVAVESAAVGFLARREHSRAELTRKLAARGAPPDIVETVLDDLVRRKLQSDARFAESLVASRAGRGQGPARIRRELAEHGIDPVVADEALEACGEDWRALAREVRRRKFGSGMPGEWKERARQMRFLEYRGFTGEQIRAALGDGDD